VLTAAIGWWFAVKRNPKSASPERGPADSAQIAPLSEARRLADQAADMSVRRYDTTVSGYATAEGLLKRALELDPNGAEIWAISADLNFMFVNRGFDRSPARMTAARDQSERALGLSPNSIEAMYVSGVVKTRLPGSLDAGTEILERVLARAPNNALALIYLGGVYEFKGRKAEGFALYDRAATQKEWAPLAYYFEFLQFFGESNFPKAEQAVRRSIAANPSVNPEAGLAILQITWKGDLEGAIGGLQRVPESDRGEQRIVWITAQVQLERRAPDEALLALDRLPEDFIYDTFFIGPKDLLVGRAQMMAGRQEAARVAFESGLAVADTRLKGAPMDPSLHRTRGELLGWLGRKGDAEAEARLVNEIVRGARLPWFRSPVTIYAAAGNADLAIPILRSLTNHLPGDGFWPLTPALLRQDPLWDKLRGDPRFQALLVEPKSDGS
jgi:tetratricopeptide (TPR) repeat protein